MGLNILNIQYTYIWDESPGVLAGKGTDEGERAGDEEVDGNQHLAY